MTKIVMKMKMKIAMEDSIQRKIRNHVHANIKNQKKHALEENAVFAKVQNVDTLLNFHQ